jgi:hypothetical protein
MSTTNATPATLAAVFAKAQPGDRIECAPGNYGDGDFYGRPATAITITSTDPQNPASFRTLGVLNASNLTFTNLRVDFTPAANTATFSWATRIQDSDHITFQDVKIIGGPAISGLNEDGSGSDPGGTGNIIGRPTARGVLIQNASDVVVDGGEIAGFYKGVLLNIASRVTIHGVEVHNTRTTAITGAQVSDLTVDGNWLHSAHPWRWGNGDHADLLALWSNGNQTTPNARVKITNNRMEQLEGEAILGMWMQGSETAPFTDFEVSGNQIIVNNLQGILIHDAQRGVVANNRLYRASKGDAGQSPTILIREKTSGIAITGNLLGAALSDNGGGANPASGNTVVSGDANIFVGAPPAPVPPVPAPTPAPVPQPAPAPTPAPVPPVFPDIVIPLLKGQTFSTSKPGKTYKLQPGQRAIISAPK